jgi:hypothetical protein
MRRSRAALLALLPLLVAATAGCSLLFPSERFIGPGPTAFVPSPVPIVIPPPPAPPPQLHLLHGGIQDYATGSARLRVGGRAIASLTMPTIRDGERNQLGEFAVRWVTGSALPSTLTIIGRADAGAVHSSRRLRVALVVAGSPPVVATSDAGECRLRFLTPTVEEVDGSLTCLHVPVRGGGFVSISGTFTAK